MEWLYWNWQKLHSGKQKVTQQPGTHSVTVPHTLGYCPPYTLSYCPTTTYRGPTLFSHALLQDNVYLPVNDLPKATEPVSGSRNVNPELVRLYSLLSDNVAPCSYCSDLVTLFPLLSTEKLTAQRPARSSY